MVDILLARFGRLLIWLVLAWLYFTAEFIILIELSYLHRINPHIWMIFSRAIMKIIGVESWLSFIPLIEMHIRLLDKILYSPLWMHAVSFLGWTIFLIYLWRVWFNSNQNK